MKLSVLIEALEIKSLYLPDHIRDTEIDAICHNSRLARAKSIFVCKTGARSDGHNYAPNAYGNGARIFVVQKKIDLPSDAAVITVEDTSKALAILAETFYRHPAREISLVGVTGTKGKTTYAISVYKIACAFGINAGYIGTNGILYAGLEFQSENTTPDCLELQKNLRNMADRGVKVCIIEVSSQALWQERIHGLNFDVCTFTNLFRDHIGGVEHPTEEHYRACKKKLFSDYGAKNIIINADSDAAEYISEGSSADNIITVSANGNPTCDIYAENIRRAKVDGLPGISFTCRAKDNGNLLPFDGREVFMSSPGLFSAENGLEIIATCSLLGIPADFTADALSSLQIPGRFEAFTLPSKKGVLFIIDYAHNGASLTSVLSAIREYSPERIICLFGSVGGRTFERRAELGRAARELADVSIITSDNPAFEDPEAVINDIALEFEGSDKPTYKIADRQKAIEFAYSISKDGDYVLLAGKGHENYQLVGKEKLPFSEKNILLSCDEKMAVLT